ncbi:FERM RhoGEF and pleckstrin domain-containing protein 2, partial [Danaus plexippus plexippus]
MVLIPSVFLLVWFDFDPYKTTLSGLYVNATNEHTVSSASLCMSPESAGPLQPSITSAPPQTPLPSAPLHASTPLHTNGYRDNDDDKRNSDTVNGNIHVNVVSASTNNMDVLSGGESDAGDTLSRRNNNSISSGVVTSADTCKKHGADVTYYVAKELLMTERTYKRDLELVTV